MSNKPKKRTKKYQGEDAKVVSRPSTSEPVVHRYEAVQRSKTGEWWQDKKKAVRLGAIATGVVGGSIWLIVTLFQIIL